MKPAVTLITDKHIVVCCGPGGVGKTTTAAALALRAADEGRRVVVCTVDPARRLAQSLGLDELGYKPQRVADIAFKGRKPKGELWAMMLDTKRTFDEMILDMTTPERAETIFSNPFYKHIAGTLSGTQEYMAMEKLWELHEEGRWELIVIDTPPTHSALDFLEAPKRLLDFFDSRFLKILLWPSMTAGRGIFSAMNFGARAVLKVASRITGSRLLEDVAGFFASFEGMYGTFKTRAHRVRELLEAKRTAFVVVSSAQSGPLAEARFFVDRLHRERIPLGGVVVNRAHIVPPDGPEDPAALAHKAPAGTLLAAALELSAAWLGVARAEEKLVASSVGGAPFWRIPDFPDDVNGIPELRRVADALFGPRI
jgi:anion-transporting  ArsA/GET3 family ATPase